jgi:hypothetical protein
MHHQSVYSLAPEFYEIQDLATDLTRHLRITYDPTQFSTIFDKLKHFVTFWTRSWLDYGMLQTGTGSAILRSNEFESKLKSRQTTWLAQREVLVGLSFKQLVLSKQLLIRRTRARVLAREPVSQYAVPPPTNTKERIH